MEREVVAVKKALCFFLAIIFVACIFLGDTSRRFSVEAYLNNILAFSSLAEVTPITHIIEIWDGTKIYNGYDGDNVILNGFDNIRLFFVRVFDSIASVVVSWVALFLVVDLLLPWNATVCRECSHYPDCICDEPELELPPGSDVQPI